MAEKKHPVMQPIYLGMGSPMPTPRVTNSMFGKVEDAFSGRSLQFEEEIKAKGKDDKENGATEAGEKTEEKSEDIAVSGDKKNEATEADEKTEEEKSEDIVVSDDKKDEDAVVMEEVKKAEASSVVVTCRDETVSLLYLLYCVSEF